ncbi:hypothetical protein VNI00_011158 [Paramarasmius palmivorus]|uniref:Uncharacterized protein n=1 Tax=Paramarasmius palmivorus TaxID=297713 RepID=A0AAW0CGQ0_9AGAR
MVSSSDEPALYAIGQAFTSPLVSMSHVKGHLRLLHAFATLRSQIINLSERDIEDKFPWFTPHNKDKRWAWFVGLAVERFELWCRWASDRDINDINDLLQYYLPPLDVFMVWHAYMLNPGWYQEDVKRVSSLNFLQNLGLVVGTHLDTVVSCLVLDPSLSRTDGWTNATQLPFDPIKSAEVHATTIVKCPSCRIDFISPLMDSYETGYLQEKFSAKCMNSAMCPQITKSMLGTGKLAKDISANGTCEDMRDYQVYLAGTLYTSSDPYDYERARTIKEKILKSPMFYLPNGTQHRFTPLDNSPRQSTNQVLSLQKDWESVILNRVEFSKDAIQHEMSKIIPGGNGKLLLRIMSAYTDGKPWSLDLVGAVLRQGTFVEKMNDLGWTNASSLNETDATIRLQSAVTRYHAFLDLIYSSPKSFFVPTLDIDLVWHTHQLIPSKYEEDCLRFLNRFLDQ